MTGMGAIGDELAALGLAFASSVIEFLPYFLFAVTLGVLLGVTRLERRVAGLFERGGVWSLVGAVGLGAVSPL